MFALEDDGSAWSLSAKGRRPNLNPDFVREMEAKLGLRFVAEKPDGDTTTDVKNHVPTDGENVGTAFLPSAAPDHDNAFNWQERFPDVFARGGFDVVLGNPPYVRQETLGAAFKTYANGVYETYAGTADFYIF
jgi:hypothetical protein